MKYDDDFWLVYISWFIHDTKKIIQTGTKEWLFYEEGREDNFCMFRYK